MASNEISLPPWASKVFFSADEDVFSVQILVEKLGDVRTKWHELGLQLRLPLEELNDIKSKPAKDTVKKKFEVMLSFWLDHGKEKTRTWDFLAKAVENSGDRALARDKIQTHPDFKEGEKVVLQPVDLYNLLSRLQAKWSQLAGSLRIPPSKIEEIDENLGVKDCFSKMLKEWITNSRKGLPTFEALIRGLENSSVANRALAINIAKDADVFELLRVSSDHPAEKESIEKELQDHIRKLEGKETTASTTTTAKPKGDSEKEKSYQDGLRKSREKMQREHDEKTSKGSSPPEFVTVETSSASSTKN